MGGASLIYCFNAAAAYVDTVDGRLPLMRMRGVGRAPTDIRYGDMPLTRADARFR